MAARGTCHHVAVVGQVDHRLEDSAHRTGAHLVAQAGREQGAGIGRGTAGPFNEVAEEVLGVARGMGEDLPAQEAVFGGKVALDVGEAQDAAEALVCQQQRGQPPMECPTRWKRPIPACRSTVWTVLTRNGIDTLGTSSQEVSPHPGAS